MSTYPYQRVQWPEEQGCGSRSGSWYTWFWNFCLDPDPCLELLFLFRIQQKMKEQILFLNLGEWILDCVYFRTVVWKRKCQIVGTFFFLSEYKVFFHNCQIHHTLIIWVGLGSESAWIQNFCPGFGSGSQKIQCWVLIRNKSFRIHFDGRHLETIVAI